MIRQYLYCHTLHRQVSEQGRLEAILPCAVDEAVEVLALFLENKGLALPSYNMIPNRIWDTGFFIARLTPKQRATGLFIPEYLELSSNRLLRQLQLWWYQWHLIRPRQQLETAVPETVFEIFNRPEKRLWEETPAKNDDLILSHLHLWGRPRGATYLRVFLGWDNAAPLEQCQALITLIEDYVARVEKLRDAAKEMSAPMSVENITEDKSSLPISTSSEVTDSQTTLMRTPTKSDSTEFAAHEETQTDSPAPRIYSKSLIKICKMAAKRQERIEQGKPIPDIEMVRTNNYGPSKNTLLKIPDLVINWDDPSFRWDVADWLRHRSGHSPSEVTQHLSKLRVHLKPEEWKRVTNPS